ncbi:MAG TPA: 2-hydroxychromene-2-carboxylate isomerase [Myxococcota bacterium]|nr:2-hydroxychromene-2-carboxylate isomerase [Myxococcota bacterium]
MTRAIEFHFDFVSPYSYLANTQLPALAWEHGAEIVYKPFQILELMKLVGNRPTTIECQNKRRYAGADLGRWAKKYGVGVRQNPHLRKVDAAQLLRGALIAADDGRAAPYVSAVFGELWNGERDLGQTTEVIAALNRAGFDGVKLLERAASYDVVARLDEATKAAAERGLFGSPSFIVGSELFFGNDRLDFVAAALAAQPA